MIPSRSPEELRDRFHRFRADGGMAGEGRADPLINALIEKLPTPGSEWPAAERAAWLDMMQTAFTLAYGAVSGVGMRSTKVKPELAAATPAGKKPKAPKPRKGSVPLKPPRSFTIGTDGFVRDHTGDRILPGDVNDVIFDERGQSGDLASIEWADGTRGIPKGMQLEIAAA